MILDQIPHFPQNKNIIITIIIIITLCLHPIIIKNKKKTRLYCHLTVQQSPDKTSYLHGSRTLDSKKPPKTTQMPEAKTLGEKTQKH